MFRYLLPFRFLLLFVLFPGLSLQAQRDRAQCPQGIDGQIQVRLKYQNNQPVDLPQLRVDLVNQTGVTVTQQFIMNGDSTNFHVSSSGVYYVKISGEGIENATSQPIEFDNLETACRGFQASYVYLKRTGPSAQGTSTQSVAKSDNRAVTSAAELRVPPSASKAFDQGMAAWQKKDYQQAAEKFEKAVADYQQYDTAYNNLGVMYAHLGQNDKAMAAFKRAVELNDKNADADRNLARMLIRQKDYPQAEELLKKALTVQAPDAATLTMLAITEIQDGKTDDALRDAQKVHALPHDGFAVVHYIAGEALEEKHQYAEAAAEYNLYLKEAPAGPDAAQVKSALQRLSSSTASAAPSAQ